MTIEIFLMVFCFPLQMIIGIVGNFLNLIVLLNRRMRTKTSVLLAMVALADIMFFLCIAPHTLMFNRWLMRWYPSLKQLIFYNNRKITSAVNMCSFASAWLIVLVCVERMMAIIWPLRAKGFWSKWQNLALIVLSIWIFGAVASSHLYLTHHIEMITRNKTVRNEFTNELETVTMTALQATLRPGMQIFWRFATSLNVAFVVVLPIILVVGTNLTLLFCLHKRKTQSNVRVKNERHRRVTLIVLVISCTFVICQAPSALIHFLELASPQIGNAEKFRTAAILSNFLVVCAKTANHFLFCLWSSHFRANLREIVGKQLSKQFKAQKQMVGKGRFGPRKMPIVSNTVETGTSRMSTPLLISSRIQNLIGQELIK